MNENILVVEDDAALRAGLCELLERQEYNVRWASSLLEARSKLKPDISLVILDVMLPDGDGVDQCRRWRDEGVTAPVLFLTARDEEYDVVRGLDAGGNDYVSKPFRVMELLSRVRVLLRRDAGAMPRKGVAIDEANMRAELDGRPLELTVTEYRILAALMRAKGVVPRQALIDTLWLGDAELMDDNTLSVHVSRLRAKLGGHIQAVRGVGYKWVE